MYRLGSKGLGVEVEVMEKIRGAERFVKEETKRTLKEIEELEREISEEKLKPRASVISKGGKAR